MTEIRRAPDGLDPDDVYAYVVRLQARIDFLEGQVRELKSAALLDEMLKQAAEIRRQALGRRGASLAGHRPGGGRRSRAAA